jgi:hypothetical protein
VDPARAERAPRAAARVGIGAGAGRAGHRAQAVRRSRVSAEVEGGAGEAQPVRGARVPPERVVELAEIPRARSRTAPPAGVLEVQDRRAAIPHQDVARVEVAVLEARGVEICHGATHGSQALAPLASAGAQRIDEELALDEARHEDLVAARETPQGERLGDGRARGPGAVQVAPLP